VLLQVLGALARRKRSLFLLLLISKWSTNTTTISFDFSRQTISFSVVLFVRRVLFAYSVFSSSERYSFSRFNEYSKTRIRRLGARLVCWRWTTRNVLYKSREQFNDTCVWEPVYAIRLLRRQDVLSEAKYVAYSTFNRYESDFFSNSVIGSLRSNLGSSSVTRSTCNAITRDHLGRLNSALLYF